MAIYISRFLSLARARKILDQEIYQVHASCANATSESQACARASRRGGAQACIYLQVRCREGVHVTLLVHDASLFLHLAFPSLYIFYGF